MVLVSLALTAVGASQSRRAVEDLVGQIVDQIDARVGARIGDLTRTAARVSEHNAHLVDLGVFDPTDLRGWLPAMHRTMDVFDELNGIAWGDERGHATWLAAYPGEEALEYAIKDDATGGLVEQYALSPEGTPGREPLRRLAYDPRERPWYHAGRAAAAAGLSAAWSPVYSWAREDGSGATLGISYSRPIHGPGGGFLGVLDTELELQSVSRFMESLRIGEAGTALIVDREGGLVAASRSQPLVTAEGRQFDAAESREPITRAGARAALGQIGAFAEVHEARRTTAAIEGEPAWIGISPLRPASGLDWILITIVPERDLLARAAEARRRAGIAAAVAVLATLAAGIGVARLSVRPVVKLRDHVRQVGAGDLGREVHLRGTSELVELSGDINRVTRDLLEFARMSSGLRVAMEVQQALLPTGPPAVDGLDIAGFSRYCDETGGDYFDFAPLGGGGVQIALGDVVGHGVGAALLMASARALLRARWRDAADPSELLTFVNREIVHDTGGIRFMTLLHMTVDGSRRALRWSTAGQHCGLLYDPASGRFAELAGAGLPLGIDGNAEYEDLTYEHVPAGAVLLLTSDGLFEAHNPERECYGWARVRESLARRADDPAEQLTHGIYDDLLAFCDGHKPQDDVTLVVVKFAR
ncbi:MAG TPA: SpoIIE family protein phosphatase [Phycisphaerales bacterium]|nr:SpoIIE family protein phosphatase [Phycisphaerales bacterium]